MEGMHFAKGAYVITEKEELVSKRIMEELNRGLTGIYAQGIYSRQDRKMLFCVVGKKGTCEIKRSGGRNRPGGFCDCDRCQRSYGERIYKRERIKKLLSI